jgi:hypothetical protein
MIIQAFSLFMELEGILPDDINEHTTHMIEEL